MRRISILLAVVASLTIAAPTMASANRLRIETGGGSAVVNGPTSATLSATPGSYAAVYVMARSTQGRSLDRVEMGFTVASGGTVSGGAPRLTVPIDKDGDGEWDDFASLDVFGCGGTVDSVGVVHGAVLVSTANPDCAVSLNAGGTYANWDAFATAHPSWRTAVGQQPFVIADWTAHVSLTGIDLN